MARCDGSQRPRGQPRITSSARKRFSRRTANDARCRTRCSRLSVARQEPQLTAPAGNRIRGTGGRRRRVQSPAAGDESEFALPFSSRVVEADNAHVGRPHMGFVKDVLWNAMSCIEGTYALPQALADVRTGRRGAAGLIAPRLPERQPRQECRRCCRRCNIFPPPSVQLAELVTTLSARAPTSHGAIRMASQAAATNSRDGRRCLDGLLPARQRSRFSSHQRILRRAARPDCVVR